MPGSGRIPVAGQVLMNEKRKIQSLRDIRAFLRAALAETALCDNPQICEHILRALDHTMDDLLVNENVQTTAMAASADLLEALILRSLTMADNLECKHAAVALNTALVCISGSGMPPRAASLG